MGDGCISNLTSDGTFNYIFPFLRCNADVPTPKKDTQEKTAQTSLDEPLILK